MAVDTIFLCFLEDLERNDGSKEKPYFMSKNMQHVVGKYNEQSIKTQGRDERGKGKHKKKPHATEPDRLIKSERKNESQRGRSKQKPGHKKHRAHNTDRKHSPHRRHTTKERGQPHHTEKRPHYDTDHEKKKSD